VRIVLKATSSNVKKQPTLLELGMAFTGGGAGAAISAELIG